MKKKRRNSKKNIKTSRLSNKIHAMGKKIVAVCVIASVFITIVLVNFTPQTFSSVTHVPIFITALGEPGEANPGGATEVMISGIFVDNVRQNISDIELSDGWEFRGETVISYSQQPAVIELNLHPGVVKLELWTSPWAGKVSIICLAENRVLDLYASEQSTITLEVENSARHVLSFHSVVRILVSFVLISSALYSLVYLVRWASSRSKDFVRILTTISPSYLYVPAAILMPNIFLFDLYNRNHIVNLIFFEHVVLFSLFFSLISFGFILLFRKITLSMGGAWLTTVLFWILFWMFSETYSLVFDNTYLPLQLIWILLNLIFIVFIALCTRKFSAMFAERNPVFIFLCVGIAVMFVLNLAPALQNEVTMSQARLARIDTNIDESELPYIKKSFYIERALPSPDIFWIHVDGMLSMQTVEKHFGMDQHSLREELSDLGFQVYETAILKGDDTAISLATLFSPSFYDNYLSHVIEISNYKMMGERRGAIRQQMALDGISLQAFVPHYELLSAFSKIGYSIEMVSSTYWPFGLVEYDRRYAGGRYYLREVTNDFRVMRNRLFSFPYDLATLIFKSTPLTLLPNGVYIFPIQVRGVWTEIPTHDEFIQKYVSRDLNHGQKRELDREKDFYRAIKHILSQASPKFTFVETQFTHSGGSWSIHDPVIGDALVAGRIELYPFAHEHSAIIMMNMVNIVLDSNPYAVIVIQADHGIHHEGNIEPLRELGFSDDEIMHISKSVFSAVRIPERYGGLDAPLPPLNITRELVNRFVGQNYDLLPEVH